MTHDRTGLVQNVEKGEGSDEIFWLSSGQNDKFRRKAMTS